jgi:NADPH-dependent 2,4-dienoyl-CoA reductase/sulfur reductase-like enzyme
MMEHYDVVVAGGGCAGVAAALSAARSGARTLLIERHAQLGGMGSNALVHTLCGLYHPDVSRPAQWLNPGLPTEIGEHMLARTGQSGPDLVDRVYVLRHHPALLAEIARELCDAEPSLTLWLRRGIDSVAREASGWGLVIDAQRVTAAAVIDTTGDALLARMMGLHHWQIADPHD